MKETLTSPEALAQRDRALALTCPICLAAPNTTCLTTPNARKVDNSSMHLARFQAGGVGV